MKVYNYVLTKYNFNDPDVGEAFDFHVLDEDTQTIEVFEARPVLDRIDVYRFNRLKGTMDKYFELEDRSEEPRTPIKLARRVFKNTAEVLATGYASGFEYTKIDVGDRVICDDCNEDYSNSEASGGLLFSSKAYCPKCAPRLEADAVKFGETKYIKARCAEGQSFRDFVLSIR